MYDYEYFEDIPDYHFDSSVGAVILTVFLFWLLIVLAIGIFSAIYNYKIYSKAGKPGWTSLIPIYNVYVKLEFLNMPWWYLLFLLVPCLNVFIVIVMDINLAKKFGKDVGFAIGLVLLPIVFKPILAFGRSEFDSSIKGILENDSNVCSNDIRYCSNCGSRLEGNYCSNCGAKRD